MVNGHGLRWAMGWSFGLMGYNMLDRMLSFLLRWAMLLAKLVLGPDHTTRLGLSRKKGNFGSGSLNRGTGQIPFLIRLEWFLF